MLFFSTEIFNESTKSMLENILSVVQNGKHIILKCGSKFIDRITICYKDNEICQSCPCFFIIEIPDEFNFYYPTFQKRFIGDSVNIQNFCRGKSTVH